jgi:hypothetical protein
LARPVKTQREAEKKLSQFYQDMFDSESMTVPVHVCRRHKTPLAAL